MKNNHEHVDAHLLPAVRAQAVLDGTCSGSLLEIKHIKLCLKASKSLARFQLPEGALVLTPLSLKMPFLEQKCPREVCIPALRAILQPGNGTHQQLCIDGNKFK